VHTAGFIAVSQRFHWLARVLGDPYRVEGPIIFDELVNGQFTPASREEYVRVIDLHPDLHKTCTRNLSPRNQNRCVHDQPEPHKTCTRLIRVASG
jgi:hypothetical protein